MAHLESNRLLHSLKNSTSNQYLKRSFKKDDPLEKSSFERYNHEIIHQSFGELSEKLAADVSNTEDTQFTKIPTQKLASQTLENQRQIPKTQKRQKQKRQVFNTARQINKRRSSRLKTSPGSNSLSVNTNDDEPIVFVSEEGEQEVIINITSEDESDSTLNIPDFPSESNFVQNELANQVDKASVIKPVDMLCDPESTSNSSNREPVIEISSSSEYEDSEKSISVMSHNRNSLSSRSSVQALSGFEPKSVPESESESIPELDSDSDSEYKLNTPRKRQRTTKSHSRKNTSTSKCGSVTPKRRVVSVDNFPIIMRRTPIKSRSSFKPGGKNSANFSVPTTPEKPNIAISESSSKLSRVLSTTNNTIFTRAKALFQRGSHQTNVIGRERERKIITEFLTSRFASGGPGALYLSGVPGTGKSALLNEVLGTCVGNLQTRKSEYRIKVAEINCVTVGTASNVFVKIYEEFASDEKNDTGTNKSETDGEEETLLYGIDRQIVDDLEKRFLGPANSDVRYILVLDELDHIMTRDQEVLHRLFQWACTAQSRLVLIGIANALDLTNRLLPRLRRAGLVPESLAFKPYEAPEIVCVLEARLWTLADKENTFETASEKLDKTERQIPKLPPLMHPAAIQLCARRVAANMGDLRKAFDICRRAIELAEAEQAVILPSNNSSVDTGFDDNSSNSSRPVGTLASPGLLWKRSLLLGHSHKAEAITGTESQYNTQLSNQMTNLKHQVFISHVAKACSSSFNPNVVHRIQLLSLHQKAVLCVLVTLEQHPQIKEGQTTPQKRTNAITTINPFGTASPVTVTGLYNRYTSLCRRSQAVAALSYTDFLDVVSVLETHGFVTALIDSPRKRKRALLSNTSAASGRYRGGETKPGSPAGKGGMISIPTGGFETDVGQRRIRSNIKQTDLSSAVSSIPLLNVFLVDN